MYRLIIGNKLYSSWSFRPWIMMKACGLEFQETLIPLNRPETRTSILGVSPSGKVPVLIDWDVVVWESLAIIEYLAEKHPKAGIWPARYRPRAYARAICAEMHAGFNALRNACPMNLGKRFATRNRGPAVAQDVARIREIFQEARSRHGDDGPFLFGKFCAADAMFAPIIARFYSYSIPVDDVCRAYMAAVMSHPAFQEWRTAALAEPWVIDEDEVDEPAAEVFRHNIA